MFAVIKTTHPTLAATSWTKVNTKTGDYRKFLQLVSEDATNILRVELTGNGAPAPTLATEGFPLAKATTAGPSISGIYREHGDKRSSGDVYVYNPTGGALTTLAVTEGQ